MPELTKEDLLNLQVTGEKLLTTADEAKYPTNRSSKHQNSVKTSEVGMDVQNTQNREHLRRAPVEQPLQKVNINSSEQFSQRVETQNGEQPSQNVDKNIVQSTRRVSVEQSSEQPPPPPYPSHLLTRDDVTLLTEQIAGVSVIDKPPLPPQSLPSQQLPSQPHTPPVYNVTHHSAEVVSNRLTNIYPPNVIQPAQQQQQQQEQIEQQQQQQATAPSVDFVHQGRPGDEVTERPDSEIVYPWRVKKQQILSSRLLARQQQNPATARTAQHPLHARVQNDPLTEITGPPVPLALPKRVYKYGDHVDSGALSDSEMGMSTVYRRRRRDDALRPSLTFVGRRIESPAGATTSVSSPVGGSVNSAAHAHESLPAKTVFSHLIKPDTRMSPITERGSPLLFASVPPSGLRKIPAHGQQGAGQGDEGSRGPAINSVVPPPPQVVLSAPSPGPQDKATLEPSTQPPAPQTPDAVAPPPPQGSGGDVSKSRSPSSDGGDHSPRPEDIYFSAAAPDLVDIPMPQVKEMINDLNRRLEAIAVQQPRIAEPPTAQELGLSFEGMKSLQQAQHQPTVSEEEKEIIINSKPMPDSTLESLKQRLFGTDITTSATFQKIYDVASPLTSPPHPSTTSSSSVERSPSPRNARRVHFADPPASSVIEIEPRDSMKRRERKRDPHPASIGTHSVKRDPVGPGSQVSRPDSLTVPTQYTPASQKALSETEVDSQIREEIYAKYSRLKSDIARETLLSPNRNPPSYLSSTVPAAYASPTSQSVPVPSGSGINVSIVHQKSDFASPTAQCSFTLPQAQPGQPSHFRYTISSRKPSDPVSFEYDFPPSYEESMRMRSVYQVSTSSFHHSFLSSSLLLTFFIVSLIPNIIVLTGTRTDRLQI